MPRRGDALAAPLEEWFAAEREQGVETVVETVHSVLSEYAPLVDLVAARMPADPDPLRDMVFILRTGALFPVYRTFSLLEQLKLNAGAIAAELRGEIARHEDAVATAHGQLTAYRLPGGGVLEAALTGIREECARLIGTGKKVIAQ